MVLDPGKGGDVARLRAGAVEDFWGMGWDEVVLSCFYHDIRGGENTFGFVAYGGYVCLPGTVSGCTCEERGCIDGIWLLLTE